MASPSGSGPASLQWTITYSAAITNVTVANGPAATAAGKSVTCMSSSGGYECVLSGPNENAIGNGVVATVAVSIAQTASGTLAMGLNNVMGASAGGAAVTISPVAGGIVVSAPPPATPPAPALTVTGITCNPPALASGAQAACSVTISGAAAAVTTVQLGSSSALLSVPASVAVAAGASSASFTATAGAVSAAQGVTISASLNGSSQSTSVSLTALTTVTALQCAPASLGSNASATCTVTISQAAPAGGTTVTITDNSAALTTPGSVVVAAAAKSATFAATTATVAAAQNVTVTASLNGSSQSATVSLAGPAATITSLQCTAATLASTGTTPCSITISQAAPAGGTTVAITNSTALLSTPASVVVPVSTNTVNFTAAAGSIPTDQAGTITASLNASSKTFTIQLQGPPTVTSLHCAAASLAVNSITTCTIGLSHAAPAAGVTVAVSANSPSVSTPQTVAVPAGAVSATFNASTAGAAGTASVSASSPQTVSITASLNGSSQTASLSLMASLAISSLHCSPSAIPSNGGTACVITLTGTAPAGGSTVSLASSSSILTVPASATVPAGASAATFIATAGAFATSQSATISATMAAATSTSTIALSPGAPAGLRFLLHGISSEVAGLSSGSQVTPSIGPSGFTGAVAANGASSVKFTPGSGVYFLNCCTNTNNAYYRFTGANVGKVFGAAQGQAQFYLTSRYSFAQRQANASGQRYAFDVRDANGHLFNFMTQVSSGSLLFVYTIAGSSQYYFVPQGAEDQLFGNGVTLNVQLTWDGSTAKLYLNGTAVKSTKYTPGTTNWSAASVFDIGAYEYLNYGGYDSCDDLVGEFSVTTPALLEINGDSTEVSGVTNGSTVTPSAGPAGFTGTVVTNGTGSVTFTPGSGVYFLNCCGNTNNAYYHFTGTAVGSIFNVSQGQISFYLTSRYTFAQRQANASGQRYAFDVRDANGHLFNFMTQVVSGYLQFTYTAAGTNTYYFVPKGTEDQLFGNGVSLKVTLKWDGTNVYLYLNDGLVKTTPYTPPTPNWTAASMFDLGAYEYLTYGGYDSSDDYIRAFTVPMQ